MTTLYNALARLADADHRYLHAFCERALVPLVDSPCDWFAHPYRADAPCLDGEPLAASAIPAWFDRVTVAFARTHHRRVAT